MRISAEPGGIFMEKHFSVGWQGAGMALAVFLFSGILQATPITNVSEGQLLSSSRQLAPAASFSTAAKAPARAAVSAARQNTVRAMRTALITNTFGTDSYEKIHVSEPQSLVMVGTGLLSMAGLIRRRLLR